ncbi:MAG: 16S rRNA (adenine(1518)-N(6)/adenine(1519)-N(6))-dimethyltransferase RsmA [Alphaproteobacteria bacterium]|nr:16S rRNA (adenine(1518)-N(6)/adenine(1519)-N(6))-dimethyltransferase RsmA [Alphaproteobacteria bacterium]
MNQSILTTKEFVEKYELMAKKALGQNFLLDANITDKIVRLSLAHQHMDNLSGQNVLEVGPGPGGLTQAVLRQNPDLLTVIEMDERCLEILAEIKAFYPQLEIVSGDALNYDWKAKKDQQGAFHIVSNLPYNISVVLLANWLKQIECFKSLTLMFQKEVGERILAMPGTKDYGRLSVISQLQCEVTKLFDLPPTCFVPAPKIWSSVLLFLPRQNSIGSELFAKVEKLTGLAFGQRRKMIRQSLKVIEGISDYLNELGIDPTLRAEDLTPDDYLNIAKRLG